MNTMSVSRLGGVCLLGGGILGFIPFALQIMVGGPPEEGANVYSYFAQNVIAGGSESLAYALVTSIAVALVAFGVYTLNGLMQEKETDAFLGLGTFLFVFGQVGLVIGWSMDIAIVSGADNAQLGTEIFMREMSLFFTFGTMGWIGGAIYSLALSNTGYINVLFLQGVAALNAILAVLFSYTLFTIEQNSAATIMPMFIGVSIGQIVNLVWQVLIGRKMIES